MREPRKLIETLAREQVWVKHDLESMELAGSPMGGDVLRHSSSCCMRWKRDARARYMPLATFMIAHARGTDEHPSPPGSIHPERPWRTAVIHQRLVEQGIVRRCVSRTSSRAATRDEIGTIHSQRHIDTVEAQSAPSATPGDIYYNEHTFDAARSQQAVSSISLMTLPPQVSQWYCQPSATGPPCRVGRDDGLLLLQQRGHRSKSGSGQAPGYDQAHSHLRLGRASWKCY